MLILKFTVHYFYIINSFIAIEIIFRILFELISHIYLNLSFDKFIIWYVKKKEVKKRQLDSSCYWSLYMCLKL